MLSIARHLVDIDFSDAPIDYTWDEWNVHSFYKPGDESVAEIYYGLPQRANLGMCIAIGEWIVHRFRGLNEDMYPWHFLEAAWVANVDLAYMKFLETRDDDWRGPVRAPINIAMAIINNFLFEDRSVPGEHVGWMTQLARHLLPDHVLFDTWHESVTSRLTAWLPRDTDHFEIGPLIARQAFDTEFEFKPQDTIALVSRLLRSVDRAENPLLRSAEELTRLSYFHGEPYVLKQE